jgi:D-3-phosphoglycerate dehydrogenase
MKYQDNKLKVGITTSTFATPDPAPKQRLEASGVEIIGNPYNRRLTEDEAFDFFSGLDGLIAGLEPITKKVLKNAPKLKAIARVGIGLDNIDLAAAEELGIKVSNTPDGPTKAVAEMTLAAALALSRNIIEYNDRVHDGKWPKIMGRSLSEQRILIIGYGRIGRAVAELMKSLGGNLLIYDPCLEGNTTLPFARAGSLEQGLAIADVISLHASTKSVILGKEEFRHMKRGVILLNSARGELVDETALIDALDKGIVASAWFDAFLKEPYKGRLLEYEQVLLTPHVGTYTSQCRYLMEMDAVKNLMHDLEASFMTG